MPDGSAQAKPSIAALFDFLISEFDLKNDAHLATELDKDPACISRLRPGKLPLSSRMILAIHEHFGLPVVEIRDRSGQYTENA
ncbi:MAG: hypothetical protein JO142_21310 [Burkholderiales bacterium]|nr:hypothetical protein [Burkholderiales bacterium]